MNWHIAPMARLTLALLAGILLGEMMGNQALTVLAGLFGMALFLRLLRYKNKIQRLRKWSGLPLLCLFMGLGYARFHLSLPQNQTDHYVHFVEKQPQLAYGKVLSSAAGAKSQRLVLRLTALRKGGKWERVQGKIMLYFKLTEAPRLPQPGQTLYFQGEIQDLFPLLNPAAFDYSTWLRHKGIHRQVFVRPGAWQKAAHSPLPFWFFQSQQRCQATLRRHLGQGQVFAVSSALILGVRSDIDDDLQTAYSQTGAVHVLSVSGLHVGILALAVRYLLAFLPAHWRRSWASALLECLVIWAFALVSGGAAATLRAALMYSFLIIGRALLRDSSIWNSLAASAFLLLCWDPNLCFDLGFQLSYLAMAGILATYESIYQLWEPPNATFDYAWKLSALGMAAQVGAGPLSVFHFHQFPWLFSVSGLVAVPLSGLALLLGMGLMVLDGLGLPATYVAWVLHGCIDILNRFLLFLDGLPYSLWAGIHWSLGICLAVYAMVFGLFWGLKKQKPRYVLGALALLLALGGIRFWNLNQLQKQAQVTIYSCRNGALADFFFRGKRLSLVETDEKNERFAALNWRCKAQSWGASRMPFQHDFHFESDLFKKGAYFQLGEIGLGIFDFRLAPAPDLARCQWIWLRHAKGWSDLPTLRSGQALLLDDSSPWYWRTKVKTACAENDIICHDLSEQGAWMHTLKLTAQ
jgi:competence protein ComEC